MTIRSMLNRRMWWFGRLMSAGMGAGLVGVLVGQATGRPAVLALVLPGFGVAFVAGMVAQFVGFLCPRCRGNLAPTLLRYGWFSVDRRVRFCPYCGTGLDEELPSDAESDLPIESEPQA
jgi:hypothetical protein